MFADPTSAIGGFQQPPFYAQSSAAAQSSATTRINFATGGFSGGGFSVKNILAVGAVIILGLIIYKRVK